MKADQALGRQPWTKSLLGILAFLRGNNRAADGFLEEAEAGGINDAEFFLLRARVRNALLDIEGANAYFAKAKAVDPAAGVRAVDGEDVNVSESSVIFSLRLPGSYLLRESLRESESAEFRSRERFQSLIMIGGNRYIYILAGILLIGFFMAARPPKVERFRAYFRNYKIPGPVYALMCLLPGSILVEKRSLWIATLMLAAALLLLMPILQWPADAAQAFGALGTLAADYVAVSLALVGTLVLVGLYLRQGRQK